MASFATTAISICSILLIFCNLTAAAAVPDGALLMPLQRIVNQSSYGFELMVGTPPQSMVVLVDTGSSLTGLAGTNSNWCKLKYRPCAKYGSYNNLTSSTAVYEDDKFYNQLINHGYGDDISDTISLGGKTFRNTTFGMILQYDAGFPAPSEQPGLVGLIPFCKNARCTNSPNYTLLQRLVARGAVKKSSLGIYFGPEKPSAKGSLLFGAKDLAKQAGKVVSIPFINPVSPISNFSPNLVNFSSVSVETHSGSMGKKKRTQNFKVAKTAYTLLDTGNPILGLPDEAFAFVKKYLQLHGPRDSLTGSYQVDCKYRQQQRDNATLLIGLAGDALKIRLPLNSLVTQLANGECLAPVGSCGSDGKNGCAFGDPFFRRVYSIFDFEKLTITLSNVNYTDTTNIVLT